MITVATARTVSWGMVPSTPRRATRDSSPWTTTSMAAPMSTGGARSKSLLSTDQAMALRTWDRWGAP